ncbi:MAG: YraN family protein [Alphaproteobacteria bacterium]
MSERAKAERRGRHAEALAAMVLRLKGYRILERRLRTPVGEVDIVATRGQTLVFVEVKNRKDDTLAAEAITPRAKARIVRAAEFFLSRHPHLSESALRFDAVLIGAGYLPRHIRDAWRPDGRSLH